MTMMKKKMKIAASLRFPVCSRPRPSINHQPTLNGLRCAIDFPRGGNVPIAPWTWRSSASLNGPWREAIGTRQSRPLAGA
jgi:hypothetical protein